MSFFSKMTKEFEGLLDKKEKPQASAEVHRGKPSRYLSILCFNQYSLSGLIADSRH